MDKEIKLQFGAAGGDISVQLKKQGFGVPEQRAKFYDGWRKSYLILRMNNFLTDSQAKIIKSRIFNRICKDIKEYGWEE